MPKKTADEFSEEQKSYKKVYIVNRIDNPGMEAYNSARRALIKLRNLSHGASFVWEDPVLGETIVTDDLDRAARHLRTEGAWVHSARFRVTCVILY